MSCSSSSRSHSPASARSMRRRLTAKTTTNETATSSHFRSLAWLSHVSESRAQAVRKAEAGGQARGRGCRVQEPVRGGRMAHREDGAEPRKISFVSLVGILAFTAARSKQPLSPSRQRKQRHRSRENTTLTCTVSGESKMIFDQFIKINRFTV